MSSQLVTYVLQAPPNLLDWLARDRQISMILAWQVM
jgi:hypothetical protein